VLLIDCAINRSVQLLTGAYCPFLHLGHFSSGRPFNNAELMPFVDTMWTSEGIDFTRGAHYWLTTISALPFGTFGEMLGADNKYCPNYPQQGSGPSENCANRWRGMLFGKTMSAQCTLYSYTIRIH
jgi:hypothetical protein